MESGAGTRSAFTGQLEGLRDLVLRLGTFVEGMLTRAMTSLLEQDAQLAREVRRSDRVADALDYDIEEAALRLLALQQPLARDLRAITATQRITTDLERVGDYSKDISKIAAELSSQQYFKPLDQISAMATLCLEMLRLSMRAFADGDLEVARQVAEMDVRVDGLWKLLSTELMGYAETDPSKVRQSIHLLLVARYLERIGDHIVNIAERTHYIATGRIEHLV